MQAAPSEIVTNSESQLNAFRDLIRPPSHSYSPCDPQHIQVSRVSEAVILPHIKNVDRNLLRKCFVDADRDPVSRKSVRRGVVEYLVSEKEFSFWNELLP